ncbi:hypothetical protein BGX29_000818 [Mortierella sp. GBA35]|nr:hypothetical protein BGX29_000818 [Mortierella sp. GBA35]
MEESRGIQGMVYAQLGTLVNLEELTLGRDSYKWEVIWGARGFRSSVYYDPKLQLTCLEMTLASGLELLSGLKRLRRLDIENMEHRIGGHEMKWLEGALPNLHFMYGIKAPKISYMTTYGLRYGSDDPALDDCGVGFTWA